MQAYFLPPRNLYGVSLRQELEPCKDSWGREREGQADDWYKKPEVDQRIAELEAENATLKRGRVSDDDIESYIEYLEADARQYERWGKVERAKGFDQLATRHEALLAERKEQSDGHIEA